MRVCWWMDFFLLLIDSRTGLVLLEEEVLEGGIRRARRFARITFVLYLVPLLVLLACCWLPGLWFMKRLVSFCFLWVSDDSLLFVGFVLALLWMMFVLLSRVRLSLFPYLRVRKKIRTC